MSLLNGLSAAGASVSQFAGEMGLQAQKSELARQQLELADSLIGARESKGRAESADIAQAAQGRAQDFTASQSDLDRQGRVTTTGMTTAAQLEHARITAATEPAETKNARARSTMTDAEKQAQDELMAEKGQRRYTFQPVTMVDPDDPKKTVSGVNKQDSHTGTIEFVPTGTDPNKPGAGGMGNRAEVYYKRLAAATDMATAASENIMQLPSSSSTGLFGGRHQGGSLMAAAKEVLTNSLTSQEVQDYNVMATGIARNLSAIETQGLAPTGSFTKSLDSVLLKEGDTYYTKLRKMAEIRQIVTEGMKANMADPKIPAQQKGALQESLDRLAKAIPFTHSDITKLQSGKGTTTLADVMRQKGLGGGKTEDAPEAPSILRYDADGNRVE